LEEKTSLSFHKINLCDQIYCFYEIKLVNTRFVDPQYTAGQDFFLFVHKTNVKAMQACFKKEKKITHGIDINKQKMKV